MVWFEFLALLTDTFYYYDSQISLSIKNPLDKLDSIIRFMKGISPRFLICVGSSQCFYRLLTKCSLLIFFGEFCSSSHLFTFYNAVESKGDGFVWNIDSIQILKQIRQREEPHRKSNCYEQYWEFVKMLFAMYVECRWLADARMRWSAELNVWHSIISNLGNSYIFNIVSYTIHIWNGS